MAKQFLFALAVVLLLTLIPVSLWAVPVPPYCNYQGKLTDPDGVPLSGEFEMNFILYTAPTGGTQQWSETQTVTVSDGIYNLILGADTAFPADLFANNHVLYLEVELKRPTDIEWETLAPRQQLTSTAYAMKAEKAADADLLDGKDSADFAHTSHSHSGSDITSGPVADSWIAGFTTIIRIGLFTLS